ncbi:MAG: DNA-3-methyladenine glycosylase family protein [Acidimicrobiales bacterium]
MAGAPNRRRERVLPLRRPLRLALTLGPVRRGGGDPCMRLSDGDFWRATRTPEGPATVHGAIHHGGGRLYAEAWGPGGAWALDALPGLVGSEDDDSGFEARHPLVAELARRLTGMRIPRTRAVVEALVPTILEQKVTGTEALASYRDLVLALGEPAPGPAVGPSALLLPPAPDRLAATPSWALHRYGIERKRADTIRRACGHAGRLEEAVSMSSSDARARLTVLPGLGPWSAAEVARVALGDPDALSVGDYHLPHQVAWALAGQARGSDELMVELLEPWRGQRGRVARLIVAGGVREPRFGPRQPLRSWRAW